MKRRIFYLLSFLFFTGQVFSQENIPAFITDSLDVYINRSLAAERLPGLAVCIVKNGKVLLMKGYGVKEWGGNDRVDENTLFMIGSNTKAFTAIALAMLQTEKILSLNDNVTKWIPEFRLDNQLAGEQAIIRDLLCHRIGFRTFQGDFTYWKSNLTREQVIEKMGHIKAVYPFRTNYGYCNAAFLTAGEIIPRATGISWEDYVRDKIFRPLGMTRTLALTSNLPAASNKAAAHDIVQGKVIKVPYCMIDNLAPAGSVSSSVNDMSKWVMTLLNNGKFEDKQVIPEAAIRETRYPHTIVGNGGVPFNKGHFELYGLGFDLREYAGSTIVSHTGAVTGFLSSVTLVPEEGLGIVVLTNSIRNSLFYALAQEILDAFLGLPYRNYSNFYNTMNQLSVNQNQNTEKQLRDSVALELKTAIPLHDYVGDYHNDVYGNMKVILENGKLLMKFEHHPHMFARLESLGGNRFYVTFSDPEFETAVFPFLVENGTVKSVTVKVADFIEYTPYVFQKMNEDERYGN
jgi:CubicO group peptidase (beta-lactamase class C family)